jgi:hypothetical protein
MWPNDRSEFLNELDATDEKYVRKKLALGGYEGWQVDAVKFWLDQRQVTRDVERADQQLTIVKRSAFWTRTRCMVGVVCSVAMVLIHWVATH